jgi:zinc and cadmium transporter
MLFEALAATIVVSLISLVGILLLSLNKKTMETVVFLILSFATGTLFAAAFFDLFPEAIGGLGTEAVFATALSGIMVFFVLERLVHWHHEHHDHQAHEKPIAYLVLLGDGLHNFFDGVAIMASFITSVELGVTTTFAIIAHEIPQELSDFTLLKYAGFSTKKALLFNLLSGLTAVIGAIAFFYFSSAVDNLQYYGLAFTAGAFLYIAGTDMLPELHKQEEASKSVVQLVSMVLGIFVIWFLIKKLGG